MNKDAASMTEVESEEPDNLYYYQPERWSLEKKKAEKIDDWNSGYAQLEGICKNPLGYVQPAMETPGPEDHGRIH